MMRFLLSTVAIVSLISTSAQAHDPAYLMTKDLPSDEEFLGGTTGTLSLRGYVVSGNGKVVYVNLATIFDDAMMYTGLPYVYGQDGILRLIRGYQPGQVTQVSATNADGSIAIGHVYRSVTGNMQTISMGSALVTRWVNGVAEEIDPIFATYEGSMALDASADAKAILINKWEAPGSPHRYSVWREGSGQENLVNHATAVSTDAFVISGDGRIVFGRISHGGMTEEAIRWTDATTIEELGYFGTNTMSVVRAVNYDGTIAAGSLRLTGTSPNTAARWVEGSGWETLDPIGTAASNSYGITPDGKIVVGVLDSRGFRWTEDDGMELVSDWLARNGVTVDPDLVLSAQGISDDGNTIVGRNASGDSYIAHLGAVHNGGVLGGVINTAQFNRTLTANSGMMSAAAQGADMNMNGAHSLPLRGLVAAGQSSVWATADVGKRQNADNTSTNQNLAELGINHGLTDKVQVGLSLGTIGSTQKLILDGSNHQRGTYVAPQLIVRLADNLYLSGLGFYSKGDAKTKRAYDNGGITDVSHGSSDMYTLGARLRLDAKDLVTVGSTKLTPFVSHTTSYNKLDAYTETSGGFPVRWDQHTERSNILRVGVDAEQPLNETITLLGSIEGAFRFEKQGEKTSGEIIGLNSFRFDGNKHRRTWLRGAFGAEVKASENSSAYLMLNLTTEGRGGHPDGWLSANYRLRF